MSFRDCLNVAVEGNELSSEQANRLFRDYDRLRRARAADGSGLADAEAKRALADLLAAETKQKKLQAKLSIASAKRIARDLDSHINMKGEKDLAGGVLDLFEHFGTSKYESVEGRRKAILGTAHAKMEATLHNFRRGALGGDLTRKNKMQLPNLVRELFGEDSGDKAAREMAQSFTGTAEWLRQRFNKAGGAIGQLEKWGMPQHHDPRALLKAKQGPWREYIKPMLDIDRMRHPLSGQRILPEELDDVLDDVWASTVTDGWNKREATRQQYGKGALANQRAEHRFLVFKSADDWLKYQEDFGGGSDPFATMMGHVSLMSRDIAAMEILGPNPGATVQWLKQLVEKEGQLAAAGKSARIPGKDPLEYGQKVQHRIDAIWGSMRGQLNTPVSTKMAQGFADVRNTILSSVLGSATLSAVGDVGTSAVTRAFAGIDAKKTASDIVLAMLPTTRREAVAAGLIRDEAEHVFHTQARYIGTLSGSKWSEYLADRVLALSGLTPWTQSARHAFGLAFMHETAKQAGKSFDQLHPFFRAKFAQYGIDATGWDAIRRAEKHDMGQGTHLLRAPEISAVHEGLAERYLGMILTETEYAVPSGSHRSRTALIDQNQPGTLPGEVMRSLSQFKSFAAVFAMIYGQRSARLLINRDSRKLGLGYVAALGLSSTLFGALALQLKQVAAGRDPRPMDEAGFYGAAFAQGGGLGLYGDFLFGDLNRFGGGLQSTVAGPVVQRGGDFLNLTLGNAIQLAQGDETHFGRELVAFARGNVPGGNIWYARLAFERGFLDNLQYALDPSAADAFRRKQQFWSREFGQDFWWKPGAAAPDRTPRMSAP